MAGFGLVRAASSRFFTVLGVGSTGLRTGIRGMSHLTEQFIKDFSRRILQAPLEFEKRKTPDGIISYVSSYEETPVVLHYNDFPVEPMFTVAAKFSNEPKQKALISFEHEGELPINWKVPG